MEIYDHLIIGGGTAGVNVATLLRKRDKKCSIAIIEKDQWCGISKCFLPEFTAGNISSFSELIAFNEEYAQKINVDVFTNEAVERIVHFPKHVQLKSGNTMGFKHCFICCGTKPFIIEPLKRVRVSNHFTSTPKSYIELNEYLQRNQVKKAIIIGSGIIALKYAESLIKRNISVCMISNDVLVPGYGAYIREFLKQQFAHHKIQLVENSNIKDIRINAGKCSAIHADETEYLCDIVISATGQHPDTQAIFNSGIAVDKNGYIQVNETQQTSHFGIYAAGDCCLKKNLFTHKRYIFPTASSAALEARVAALNCTGKHVKMSHLFFTNIFSFLSLYYAVSGIDEQKCNMNTVNISRNFNQYSPLSEKKDSVDINAIFNKQTDQIVRVEMCGNYNIHGVFNEFVNCIQKNATAEEMFLSYHPYSPKFVSPKSAVNLISEALMTKK